jgi:hypothetical protein
MTNNKINLETVLVFDLVSKTEYIAKLNADIESWKKAQVEQAHSATDIRHYAELVYGARKELERVGA